MGYPSVRIVNAFLSFHIVRPSTMVVVSFRIFACARHICGTVWYVFSPASDPCVLRLLIGFVRKFELGSSWAPIASLGGPDRALPILVSLY